jgi:hypothetical protein
MRIEALSCPELEHINNSYHEDVRGVSNRLISLLKPIVGPGVADDNRVPTCQHKHGPVWLRLTAAAFD